MVRRLKVEGLSALECAVADNTKPSNTAADIYVLFCGTPNTDGSQWCPDCAAADPVVESCLSDLPDDSIFIKCLVGDRTTWKNPDNEFRKHSKLRLTCVPTLLKWASPQRLLEDDCCKKDLVKMLFTED